MENLKLADTDTPATSRIKEADLARHLQGDAERKNKTDKGSNEAKDSKVDKDQLPLARRDYAVYEALNLLKGLDILQRRNS